MKQKHLFSHKNSYFPDFIYDKPIVIVYYNIHPNFCQ